MEAEIKTEQKCEGEDCVSNSPRPPVAPEDSDLTQDSTDNNYVVVKKKAKMEIEIDFSLIKNEPRERRAVKRYE